MIKEEMKVAMQGIIPSVIVTCNDEGIPNTTIISQVYYVNDHQVALSHQFFNKTQRNIRVNPHVCVVIFSPDDFTHWKMQLEYSHDETEGELFDEMVMQLEAIASMCGMEDVFALNSAMVFSVKSVTQLN